MSPPSVSILIPSFKTPDLTKLCLRLVNKHTCKDDVQVFVIDNDSGDASLEYLRSLSWLTLLERRRPPGELPTQSHSRALDLALELVETPYVLSMHTDTLVCHPGWLTFLRKELERDAAIAAVGSWKLETKPLHKRIAKKAETWVRRAMASVRRQAEGAAGSGPRGSAFLRSHCALYRTHLLRRYGLGFSEGGESAGKLMHERLRKYGHKTVFVPPKTLMRYVLHLNHATMVLNPELGATRRTILAGRSRLSRMLALVNAEQVLADDGLDR